MVVVVLVAVLAGVLAGVLAVVLAVVVVAGTTAVVAAAVDCGDHTAIRCRRSCLPCSAVFGCLHAGSRSPAGASGEHAVDSTAAGGAAFLSLVGVSTGGVSIPGLDG